MEKRKSSKKEIVNSNTISFKQVIVSIIILLFAIGLLIYTFFEIFGKDDKITTEQTKEVVQVQEEQASAEIKPVEEETVAPEVHEEVAKPEETKTTTLNFNATIDSDFEFEIFYTTKEHVWFTQEQAFTYKAVMGTHSYSITLPETKVYRIRLDFGSNPVNVTLKDIHLSGEQTADLNDFNNYEYNDIQSKTINEDGSVTISSEGRDPYMAYRIE